MRAFALVLCFPSRSPSFSLPPSLPPSRYSLCSFSVPGLITPRYYALLSIYRAVPVLFFFCFYFCQECESSVSFCALFFFFFISYKPVLSAHTYVPFLPSLGCNLILMLIVTPAFYRLLIQCNCVLHARDVYRVASSRHFTFIALLKRERARRNVINFVSLAPLLLLLTLAQVGIHTVYLSSFSPFPSSIRAFARGNLSRPLSY